MLRTLDQIGDDLQQWQERISALLPEREDEALGRLLHEVRALERGHESRFCGVCAHYAIDQLSALERIAQADALRVRILREGYPLADVLRSLNEQTRQSLIAGTRRTQVIATTGWTETQVLQRLWDLFPERMQRAGKPRP